MAIVDITKPMALDETLQGTNDILETLATDATLQTINTALGLLSKDATLQLVVTALSNIGLNNVGNLSQLTTEQKTSLVAAINELVDDVDGKVDKEAGKGLSTNDYTNTDKGKVDKIDLTKTHVTGNPISITTESAQMCSDTVITLNQRSAGNGIDKIEVLSGGKNLFDKSKITKDTRVNASGTVAYQGCDCSDFIPVKPNTAYYFTNMQPSNVMNAVYFYNKAKENTRSTGLGASGTASVSTSDGEYYVRLNIPDANLNTAQMEEGTTGTTYEPYHLATNILLSLGQTVYGGSLYLEKGIFITTNDDEIQLTPHEISLLSGYNYISTNCDEIDTYYKEHGEVASMEDVGALASVVNNLGDRVDYVATNAGDYVDLTSTAYTFPADGYVVVDSQSVTSGIVRVQLISNNNVAIGGIYMNITSNYQAQTTFVRKGMSARVIYDTANTRKRYFPLY